MDVLESFVGDCEVPDWRDCVASDFCLLAMQALASPFCDVRVHGGPHEFLADGLAGPFNPWVAKAVDGIKYSSSEGQRYEGACRTVAAVDDEVVASNVDVFEIQP